MKGWMILLWSLLIGFQLSATQYTTFEENGKVGMKDEEGRVVLPPSFEALGWSDGNFSVIGDVTGYRLKGLWGIINLKKEFVTKADYESLIYSDGSLVARKKINSTFYKSGCLNLRGEIKIPFSYDGILIQGMRAIVFNLTKTCYRYGLIDINNKLILPVSYKYIRPLGTLRYAVENDENKIALYNEEGNPVTEFAIDSVSSFYKSYAFVYQNHLQGLIDRDGITKLETKYQSIKITSEGTILAQLPNDWCFINTKNEIIQRIFADELKTLNEKLFYVKKGGSWGLIDADLKQIIPVQYESITEIDQGKYLARINSKMGVLNSEKTLIPFLYDSLIFAKNSFKAFNKVFGWQLLDENGKPLTDRYYEQLTTINEQIFLARNKTFWGLINSQGKEFVHCVFDSISTPVNGLIAVKFKGKYGIINENEDWIVAPQSFPTHVINERVYLLKQPDNYFVKTYSGEIKYFTPYQLKFLPDIFIETLPNGIEKTINYEGLIIERTKSVENTEEIFHESEGLRGIKKDGRYGFVDPRGRLRIANRYDSIGEFHEGLAAIKLIGKWGFVNTNDQIIINPNYDRAVNFNSGIAVVSRNGKSGMIDKKGRTILPFRYDHVLRQQDSFLLIVSNLKGLADASGNVAVEPRYEMLKEAYNNFLIACIDNKCGVITNNGLNVIPMVYDQLIFNSTKNIFLGGKKSEWQVMNLK